MYKWILACVLALVTAMAGSVGAAGYSIYEQGTAAMGQASAFTARADDPSAIFFNPAGIAGQEAAIHLGATLILPSSEFDGDNPYPGISTHEKMKTGVFYPPHVFIVYPTNSVTLGLGLYAPFGLGTEWKDDFSGRAVSKFAEIQTIYLNPVVAKKFGPVSVGVGVEVVYSTVALKRTVMMPVVYGDDVVWTDAAELDLEGDNGFSDYGFNAGVQYSPMEMLTVGARYQSKVETNHTGDATFHVIEPVAAAFVPPEPASVEAMIPMPAIWSVGVAVRPTDKLTVEANLVSMQWSAFDSLKMTFTEVANAHLSESIPELYDDAFSYRIGAEYEMTPNFALRCGYIFDETPQPTQSVSPLLPGADRNSYQIGCGYTMDNMTIDFAYMYLDFMDRSTERSSFAGYDGLYTSTAHLIGLTLGYSF
jgi:long-chain fatty acid transport protein